MTKLQSFSLSLLAIGIMLILPNSLPCQDIKNGKSNLIIEKEMSEAQGWLRKSKKLEEDGKYKEAINTIQAAKATFAKYAEWEKYVKSQIAVCEQYGLLYENKERLEQAEQAISDIFLYQLDHREVLLALARNQKIQALIELVKIDEALSLTNQILPVFQKHNFFEEQIACQWNIAKSYYYLNNFDSVKVQVDKGLNLGKTYKVNTYSSDFLSLLSAYYFHYGDNNQAITTILLAIKNIEDKERLVYQDKEALAQNYQTLGVFYDRKGELDRALDAYNKSGKTLNFEEAILRRTSPYYHINVSNILFKKRQFKEALNILNPSVVSFKNGLIQDQSDYYRIILTYNMVALNYLELEEFDSVIYYSEKALAIPLDFRRYFSYNFIGKSYIEKGAIDKGKIYLEKASALKSTRPSFLVSLNQNLARLNASENDYEAALLNIQKSLTSNCLTFKDTSIHAQPPLKNISIPLYFLESLQSKAQYLAKRSPAFKDQIFSLETYQLAAEWIDSLQLDYVLEGSQLFWSKRFKEVYEGTIKQAYHLYQQTGEKKYIDTAFETAEKSKALLLLEGLKDRESQSVSGLPDSLLQKEKDLKLEVAFYEKSLQTATEKKQEKRIQLYQSYLADKRLALGNLKEQMEQDYPDYYQLKYANINVSIKQLQAAMLNDQSALIEYFVGDTTAFVFVIGKKEQHFFPIAAPELLATQTGNLQQILIQPANLERNATLAFQNFNQRAFNLYQSILATALAQLPITVNQLIISPDGFLNNLPFEVLNRSVVDKGNIDFGQLPYLLKDYQIHYVYSANLWKNNQQRQQQLPPNTECLALAPPYKGDTPIAQRGSLQQIRGTNTQLEGTGREIQAIAQHFDGQFDWSPAANEANFKALSKQFGLLHLAMHGEVTKDDTRLIFANLELGTMEDNYLYPYEIGNLDLQAQLAVLSACETGLGKYIQGEGIMSLARSFMSAGVPSLVMSLWKVDDLTTSELMPTFYEQLASGQSKKAALHIAKQKYLQQADLEYRHPYYWSGFVLLGDETSLKVSSTQHWWYIGGGLLFLLSIFGYRSLKAN